MRSGRKKRKDSRVGEGLVYTVNTLVELHYAGASMETCSSEIVRAQLEKILASEGFSRNDRLSGFLRFVIEQELSGRGDQLKESIIGVEVFGRDPGYDPRQDSVVRTEAAKLRARLAKYYATVADPLVIELPKGAYRPVFRYPPSQGIPRPSRPRYWPQTVRSRTLWVAAVAGVLALALCTIAWWRFHETEPIAVAVLPLLNLNQDPANDYFADGLTSEIIRNLTIIEGLAVRSEASSFAVKGKPQKARDAGKQLEAEYLVEGSVLRSGQQLRINVELIRARDDFPIWSARYDRELADIFAIQDDISRGVVNNLRLKLGHGRRRYETSTEAYDLYLRGRALQAERPGDPDPRIPIFEQAIVRDPSFAPAYAGLAVAHLTLSGQPRRDIPVEVAKMRAAAEKAIQLDPLSAESYDALGAAYARDAQWDQAEKSFRRAIEIQPGLLESHGYLAMYYLLPLGRIEEAIRQLQIAEKSRPVFTFFLGDALADTGRNGEAAIVCEKLAPGDQLKNQCLPGALEREGRADEVIQTYGARSDNNPDVRAALACAYTRLGRREDAERTAVDLNVNARLQAFACLGDKDRVFDTFESNAALGPIRIGWFLLRVDREHRGLLLGDSRLHALRKRVGLPE